MIKFKLLFLLFLIIAVASELKAQDKPGKSSKDRIELKDGSIVVGTIIQYESEKNILFILEMNGDTISIPQSKIYKVLFNGGPIQKKKITKPFKQKEKGIFFEFSTILKLGKDYNGKGFRLSFYKSFNPAINFGVNVNLDKYEQEFDANLITISLGYRYYLKTKRVQPFVGADVGYGIARHGPRFYQVIEKDGGMMYHPYLGLQIGIFNSAAISFSMGYKYQKAFYLISDYNGDIVSLDHKFRKTTLAFHFFSYF